MLAKVKSYALEGLDGYAVNVELDISAGIPSMEMVGLASTATKESKERIRSAVKNSGYKYPLKRITVNLAPADTKKEGPVFDLAIAVALLRADEQFTGQTYKDYVFLGELSLDGRLSRINGVMPILISAYQKGYRKFVIPYDNRAEAAYIKGAEVYALKDLGEVDALLSCSGAFSPVEHADYAPRTGKNPYGVDFSDIKGQTAAKRAIEVAVSGGHNVLMIGPPGTGKTMLSRSIPSIMPDMTFEEALEVTKIHSIAGVLDSEEGIITQRPFRTPHHSATLPSLIGGGQKSRPGEVSLAHYGVLFLDEMPEYSRHTLESLRQPLEDKCVTVARAMRTVSYPSAFMLVASMNPCPCGNLGSKTAECTCTAQQIRNYLSKLSGPLLDRIDIQIEVDNLTYEEITGKVSGDSSETVKERINNVRRIQAERFRGTPVLTNAQMNGRQLEEFCRTDAQCDALLKSAFKRLNLSARATTRILKVARTVADMEGSENIKAAHLAEAIQYRSLDRKLNV